MKHLSENELSAWIDGALDPDARRDAERHLAACHECRESVAELEAQDHTLVRLLEHDPGEAYFERFADRIAARIRSEGRSPAAVAEAHVLAGVADVASADEPPPATERRLRQAAPPAGSLLEMIGRWLSGPRLAWVGATAAVIAAGGVVFLISREGAFRTLSDRNITVRGRQVEGGAPAPPSASMQSAPAPESAPPTAANENATGPVASKESASPARPGERRSDTRQTAESTPASPATGFRGPSAPAPTQTSTLARRENAAPPPAIAPGAAAARSRQVERKGGEDVPVAGTAPPSAALQSQPTTPPPTNRLAKIKQSQVQSVSPMHSAPQSARDQAVAQQVRLCGTVRDSEGRPIPNAQVGFADASTGVTTDANGTWCLETAPGERTLSVMAVGFRESRHTIDVTGAAEGQDVTLAAVPVMESRGGSNPLAFVERPKTITWPASVASFAAEAQQAMDSGVRKGSAFDFDRSAQQWERVANVVHTGPVGSTARRNLADARYRAWQVAPSQLRSIAAISALTAYMRVAPKAEQDEIVRRLNEVRGRK